MASLRTARSVGPPTVSDTISPPDQLSVDGDYVFIFGTSTVIFSYQQNGKTFAIRQPNDRVASVSTRFLVFFGDGMAPVVSPSACECSVNSSSPLGGNPFCARRRFELVLDPIPNSLTQYARPLSNGKPYALPVRYNSPLCADITPLSHTIGATRLRWLLP